MQTTSSPAWQPGVDLVYAKSAAGRHEVGHRGAGLNARQRTALIMLDGQRQGRALEALMPADQVAPILAALIALGLIAAATPAAAAAAMPAATLASAPAAAPVAALARPDPDPAALAAIKAELIHAAEAYLGVMAGDVVARVRRAADATDLLRVLGHWHMALQDSKHGKAAATTLLHATRARLLAASTQA